MKAFFNSGHELAALITAKAAHNPERDGKYLESGLKPIEEFCGDILNNLVAWSIDGMAIFYKTKTHNYIFELVDVNDVTGMGIVEMTRYEHGSWRNLSDWANLSSVRDMGKEFLANHKAKRVPLFA